VIELPVGYYLVKFLNSFIFFSVVVLPFAARALVQKYIVKHVAASMYSGATNSLY
jgi:hypothetical protein